MDWSNKNTTVFLNCIYIYIYIYIYIVELFFTKPILFVGAVLSFPPICNIGVYV